MAAEEGGIIEMYIRKVHRKCGVRGCRNTDAFAISRAREIGNTVIICRDCLKDALSEIDALNAPKAEVKPAETKPEAPKIEKETEKKETAVKSVKSAKSKSKKS